ncbi:MAG: EAL domain-containing protein [Lachnospiraceae bacterium]|nr:EAL domain-containing protein [Lachnospiraceae bacterium]
MFTWNFQYISKARMEETLNSLSINAQKGDILIRIHTAIHLREEAVDLARYVKNIVPKAKVFGTSTTGVINWGKLSQNQCIYSVTLMDEAKVDTVMLPTFYEDTDEMIPSDILCKNVKEKLGDTEYKLMLTFLTQDYLDVYDFVENCNDIFPGTQMIGGLACVSNNATGQTQDNGFVFDEKGWSDRGIIIAAISGKNLECFTSVATGLQTIGEEIEVTDTFANCILETDNKDAAEEYRISIGDELKYNPSITSLFPFAYADEYSMPVLVGYHRNTSISDAFPRYIQTFKGEYEKHPNLDIYRKRELIIGNHNVGIGKKLKRAFIYDKKIISDNRSLFRRVENFEKAETIFGYSCMGRSQIYSNCLKWELSAYENSNMCGCLTGGEIVCVNGHNTFANCTFVVSVFGEKEFTQRFNPYIFSHTDSLAMDNQDLVDYLMDTESILEGDKERPVFASVKEFVRECELKLFYSETEGLPNEAALNMDVEIKGYDRICMIDITDSSGMQIVFPELLINLTYKNYITQCAKFCEDMHLRLYLIDGWHIAIATPSYRMSLSQFEENMKILQKNLFESSREYIAIVPLFCLIDGCNKDNIDSTYYSARVEMMKKNIQFYVTKPGVEEFDEEKIRKKYHMVNVINYAIAHDRVVPFFQGIYDNKLKKINHYESLMRLEDENGKIYYPNDFLDVARSFGHLYDSLSAIMIRKVFDRFKGEKERSVSINLGIRDIRNTDITEYIYDFLSTAKRPHNFVFEILENEDVEDYDTLIAFVDRIHSLGGMISIDDFGSGYSNLQHLMSIHSDYIKIDGSIIRQCCESSESENLIALITGWKEISTRNIGIVAEYVENIDIQEKMAKFGIDYSQGYLFSKPSPELE